MTGSGRVFLLPARQFGRRGDFMARKVMSVCSGLVLIGVLFMGAPQGFRPAAVEAQGAMPDGATLLAGQDNAREWLMYGHDYTNDRYSALDQINTSNVSQLVPRWIFQTGI